MIAAEAEPENRRFGFLDHAALWGSLGISLYVMPFGSLLVPALSLERAILATVVAAFIGALVMAAIAAIAARTGQSTLELLAGVFGPRASAPMGLLLLVRNVALGAFALALIADSAQLVSERALGAGLRPVWVLVFAVLGLALARAGPDFVVRRLLKRGGFWLVLLVAAGITLSAYMEFGVPAYLTRPAVGGWPSFWQAVDVMLIVPLLWLPLVADYARLGSNARSAAGGTFGGFFIATAWLGVLGIVYLPAVESGDIAGFVVGMKLGMAALVILLVLQLDEVFANMNSAVLALGFFRRLNRRVASFAVTALVVAAALPFDLVSSEGYFLLIGSLFVPLFGVLIADQMLERVPGGKTMPAVPLVAWALGFVAYQWISPPDVGWWRDMMERVFADGLGQPFPLTDEITWLGAAIPSFLVGFAVQMLGGRMAAAVRPRSRLATGSQYNSE